MKIKEYLNSLISRRKSTTSSKSDKPKSHHTPISSADCHYEISGYEDPNKLHNNDHHSRTQILLNRHAQLVNTIVGIRSQQETSNSHCGIANQSDQQNLSINRNYSSTLATSNPHRECQYQRFITSSNNSLTTKTRQRSKIRTNPWINTTRISQPEYPIYDPTLSSGLIHSESFPQTISNGNIHSTNPSNIILHQSDSGHGFSLTSSRVIDSSSPDNTSSDGPLLDEKQRRLLKINSSDNKRRIKKPIQSRYQRPSNTRISTNYHSHNPSPPLYDDHFSTEFEDIVENERLHKQRLSTRNNPFILPLDKNDVKLSSPSSIVYSPKLKKTNSHTILKHIEEIENEIRMIKNLNLNSDQQILSSNKDERQLIHEQIDQWVEKCLINSKTNPTTRLHNECNHLSNTIKDYVVCAYSDNNHQISSLPKPQKKTELMTAFYLSSIPTTKRIFSFIDQPLQLLNSQTIEKDIKSVQECPF